MSRILENVEEQLLHKRRAVYGPLQPKVEENVTPVNAFVTECKISASFEMHGFVKDGVDLKEMREIFVRALRKRICGDLIEMTLELAMAVRGGDHSEVDACMEKILKEVDLK